MTKYLSASAFSMSFQNAGDLVSLHDTVYCTVLFTRVLGSLLCFITTSQWLMCWCWCRLCSCEWAFVFPVKTNLQLVYVVPSLAAVLRKPIKAFLGVQQLQQLHQFDTIFFYFCAMLCQNFSLASKFSQLHLF